MLSRPKPQFGVFRTNLRVRFALGIAFPLFLILLSLTVGHYWYERRLLEDQIRLNSLQLGELLLGSLQHAMLVNDSEMLTQSLANVGEMEQVQDLQIVNLDGQVWMDSHSDEVGLIRRQDESGCRECHSLPAELRPRTVKLAESENVLRVSIPVTNEAGCETCHFEPDEYLGIMLTDVSMDDMEKGLFRNLQVELLFLIGATAGAVVILYLLFHWFLVRRLEALRRPLAQFARGDFSSRLPVFTDPVDELGQLSVAFNQMADELERHNREQEERSQLRQQAVVEERERIAKELHDGMAQLLGYVNTKVMAVRLMVNNRQIEPASRHLLQLEEAARELFVEMREAILGLKLTGRNGGTTLSDTFKEYTAQFSRLSNLPVDLSVAPEVNSLELSTEEELQLLRILQESLTNIRKHALASQVSVKLDMNDLGLDLTIHDNGIGFDPDHIATNHRPHFGLTIMRERAEAIHAQLDIVSGQGAGTVINVHKSLQEYSNDPCYSCRRPLPVS